MKPFYLKKTWKGHVLMFSNLWPGHGCVFAKATLDEVNDFIDEIEDMKNCEKEVKRILIESPEVFID